MESVGVSPRIEKEEIENKEDLKSSLLEENERVSLENDNNINLEKVNSSEEEEVVIEIKKEPIKEEITKEILEDNFHEQVETVKKKVAFDEKIKVNYVKTHYSRDSYSYTSPNFIKKNKSKLLLILNNQ